MELKEFNEVVILEDDNVKKIVFKKPNSVVESVLYKYGSYADRTVICCSTQCGCPVGCTFCGTGKNFIKNLTSSEILEQINFVIENIVMKEIATTKEIEKFQIMFMSMGEPMLNWNNVEAAIRELNLCYPNAQLLLSTVGIKDETVLNKLLSLSKEIDKVGLQFSIHEAFENKRNILIPFKNKLNLKEIAEYGIKWNRETKRPVYLNYCVTPNNSSEEKLNILMDLFDKDYFNFTFSVICNIDKNGMSKSTFEDIRFIQDIEIKFMKAGYNTRIFDPAGKDTIGGGCGQLWFVQDFLKEFKNKKISGIQED